MPVKPLTPVKFSRTPEPQRRHARNYYRRKAGIPKDAPLHTRAEPFNRKRRGTGNVSGRVSMSTGAWQSLDRLKGKLNRGEYLELLIHENKTDRLEKGTL